jgi:hypothetical protein
VTGLGFAVLGLLFVGLAIVAAVLYLPAFVAEQAGLFSALRPPTAIERVEWVQAVVAIIAVGLGFWLGRSGTQRTAGQ